jgi:hypothetical protein
MAEYVLQDKDKAAFINKMNKVLSQLQPGLGVDNTSFIDVPENKDDDKCIFVTGDPVEEKVLDQLIDQNVFNFKVKKISLKKILKEIRSATLRNMHAMYSDEFASKMIGNFFLTFPFNASNVLVKLEKLITLILKSYKPSPNGEKALVELENLKNILSSNIDLDKESIADAMHDTIDNLDKIRRY